MACKDGKITRAELRQALAKVKIALHDPRRADGVHRERRRRRARSSTSSRSSNGKYTDRLVALLEAGCGRVAAAAPRALVRSDELEPLRHRARRRDHPRQRLRADRPRLLDGVRDPEAAELRPRRRLHGRRVHRLRRADRAAAAPTGFSIPIALLLVADVRRVDARRRPARRRDRALRLPPPARRAANRAADHGARRLVLPRERARCCCSAPTTGATTRFCWNNGVLWIEGLHAPGRRARRAGADHRRRRRDRADDRAHATSSRARSSAARCARPRSTARRPR